jgi:hypothetical protein
VLKPAFLITGLMALLLSFSVVTQAQAPADSASGTPDASPHTGYFPPPQQLCSAEDMARFEPATMISDLSMAVHPLGVTDTSAWMALVELPAGACVGYHSHDGAGILYVLSGSIVYTAEPWPYRGPTWGTPVATGLQVMLGTVDDPNETMTIGGAEIPVGPDAGTLIPFGVPTTVERGEWVTQNGLIFHTYQAGASDTVIILSGYASDDTVPRPGCQGGCVGRGH